MNDATRELRRVVGARRVGDAVRLAMDGRLAEALDAADYAARIDESIPHPHVVAAKVHFWTGDLGAAQLRLDEARRRGLPSGDAADMQAAIDEMRMRAQAAARARAHAAELRAARRDAILKAVDAVGLWCTTERLAMVVVLLTIMVTLMLTATFPGVMR
jgi:ATP/maltotriose-dependent transcriptional regulator MalT